MKRQKTVTRDEYVEHLSSTALDRVEDARNAMEMEKVRHEQEQKIELHRQITASAFFDITIQKMEKNTKEKIKELQHTSDHLRKECESLLKVYDEKTCKDYIMKEVLPNLDLQPEYVNEARDALIDEGEKLYGYSAKQLTRVERQVMACIHIILRLILS